MTAAPPSSAEINPAELLDSVTIASARGKRPGGTPIQIEQVRELTADDLPALTNIGNGIGEVLPAGPISVASLRQSHHTLARSLANGASLLEASLTSGYSIAYISTLKKNPAFADLLTHYANEKKEIFLDVAKRMRDLGMSTLEELQKRLEEEPEGWTKRELMDLSKMLLIDGTHAFAAVQAAKNGPVGGQGVKIEVNFVQPQGANAPIPEGAAMPGPIIDVPDVAE